MRAAVVAVLATAAALAAAGCVKKDPYVCATDEDCTVGGVPGFCEFDSHCSVADATCASGHRYGDEAGEVSGECTGEATGGTALCVVGPGIAEPDTCASVICEDEPWCCDVSWDKQCVLAAEARCDLQCDEIFAGNGYMESSVFADLDAPRPPLWSSSRGGFAYTSAWGDANNDGRADLAVAREGGNGDGDGVEIYFVEDITDDVLVVAPADIAGPEIGSVDYVEWRDYDADGYLDLLASGGSGTYLVKNSASGFSVTMLAVEPTRATWVDADGEAPYALVISYWVQNAERVVLHAMDEALDLDPITDENTLSMFASPDLVWCHVTGNTTRDLVGSGGYFVGTADGFAAPSLLGESGYGVVCADFDDDGDNDIAIGNYDAPVSIVRNQGGLGGAASFQSVGRVFLGGITAADLDNNGRLDLVFTDGRPGKGSEIPNYLLDNTGSPGAPDWFAERTVSDFNTGDNDAKAISAGPRPRPAD
jgi:hypothetical protein